MKKNNQNKEVAVEKGVEIYRFTHKEIGVNVKIDYKENKISILDHLGDANNFKRFVFADRGVQFMQGWLNILEAIQEAVKDAKKRYEAELAEQSKFKPEMLEVVLPVFTGRRVPNNKKK